MPDAFQIPGISVVEALAQLQKMLWTLQNQRLDVVRLLANLITVIRSDVDDPEAFEWAPNAQWFVEDPGQVDTLKIDPTVAQITLQAEALLKGDLQNIMGGLPMASGADSQTIDQQTATGISIITTIAQRIIQARKQHYLWAYADSGSPLPAPLPAVPRDDRVDQGPRRARRDRLQARSHRSRSRATTTSRSTSPPTRCCARSAAPSRSRFCRSPRSVQQVFAMSGAPLNLKAFMEKTLDAYDIPDKERYFLPPGAGSDPGTSPPPSLPRRAAAAVVGAVA
jgi:hypothetical protein